MKKLLIGLFAGFALILAQAVVCSTGALPDEVLAQSAELIVSGRIVEIRSVKKPVESKEMAYVIVSTARVIPEMTIKGETHGAPIVIEFAGGRVGGEISLIEDSPVFEENEQVILFLKQIAGKSTYALVGMNQGKYLVKEGMVTRRSMPVEQFVNDFKALISEQ